MRDLVVSVGGIKLQIREDEREGEPIVFLHYGGSNLMMWQGIVPYFQHDYHLLLVDLRGHGKSDKPPVGYHIDDMAGDVAGILEHLRIDQAHIVGSSLGAEVGLGLAARYSEKVTSLVCEGALYSEYGPYGIWEGSEAEFKENVARQLAEVRNSPDPVFATAEALVAASRQTFDKYGWWNPYFEAMQEYDACKLGEGRYTHSWQNWAMEEYLEHYFDYRFEEYYKRVRCPVLMLPSEEEMEDVRMVRAMNGLSELAPRVKIVRVPGAVHPYGWLLDPDGMSKAVLEFLAEIRH
jgi:pimeloyl-ACP methyl ester carboxylesterase